MKWFGQLHSEETKGSTLQENEHKDQPYPSTTQLHESCAELTVSYKQQLEGLYQERKRMIYALRSLELEIADKEKAQRGSELTAMLTEIDDGKRHTHEAAKDTSKDEEIAAEEILQVSENISQSEDLIKQLSKDLEGKEDDQSAN